MVHLAPAFVAPAFTSSDVCTRTLGDEIAELAAHIHVATYCLLLKLLAFDDMQGWAGGGFRSTAEWLSWRTGIAPGAARERVRVARALKDLPRISAAMERGELSYSKARALTRVADPESERRLLDVALNATAAQVERLVAGWARLDRVTLNLAEAPAGAETPRPACRLILAPDPATGLWRIHGTLEPEVALMLERALAMAAEAVFRGSPAGEIPPLPERKAEALGLLAEAALRAGVEVEGRRTTGRADRFQVMLHVSAETPADTPADSCGACDASRVQVTHGPDGSILDVGRRTRIVPPALRRALEVRDDGCAHPHCTNRICDAHHVIPWQDGGATSLENLVLLCRRHHRAVHRGELVVEAELGAGAPGAVFRDAEERELTAVPALPALPDDPVAALRREHGARGLDPARLAALPKWDGTPLNLGLALDWLWRPRGMVAKPSSRYE